MSVLKNIVEVVEKKEEEKLSEKAFVPKTMRKRKTESRSWEQRV